MIGRRLRPLRTLLRVRSESRGEGPVEMAIIALPMVLVTFIVLQAALVYYARSTALAAATQGANAARSYGSTTAAGEAKAKQFLGNVGGPFTMTGVTARTAPNNSVIVTVTGKATSIIPGLTFTVTQTAHGPVERFVS